MTVLKKVPTWICPRFSTQAGVGVGCTDVGVGASVGVNVGKGVGVTLAVGARVAVGVTEGTGEGVGESTRTSTVGTTEAGAVVLAQPMSTNPNNAASRNCFIECLSRHQHMLEIISPKATLS